MLRNLLQRIAQSALPLAAAAVALFVSSGSASAQCLTCVNSLVVPTTRITIVETGQTANPGSVLEPTNVGLLAVQLGPVPAGNSFTTGQVLQGWCAAWYNSPFDVSSPLGYYMFSTYGSIPPPAGDEPRPDGYTFNMINYILNHKQGSVQDVQNAIWLVMTGTPNPDFPATATAIAMKNDAFAYGLTYVPSYPGIMAVFLSVGPDLLGATAADGALVAQSLFLEVPLPATQTTHTKPTLVCPSSSGSVGVPYSSKLVASGGTSPYTFSFTGYMPSGLLLTASTGVIAGTPTVAGTFNFTAQVVDAAGLGADSTTTAACSITVTGTGSVSRGDTATIGFWANKNGQYLISIVNATSGCANPTNLGNWLANSYPALFGNLLGKTNSQVAAQFITYFKVTGAKTMAQIMAGALAVYVTDTDLSGSGGAIGTARTKFHFNSSTTGTGAKTYNVGAYGTALGLSNYTVYSVTQLLVQANAMKLAGTFDLTAWNAIFDGINQRGDII